MLRQEFADFVLADKYLARNAEGEQIETTIDESRTRVARSLAEQEQDSKKWEPVFRDTLEYAACGGRIMANAGAQDVKKSVSLINCVVSDRIEDSMDSILTNLHDAGMTLKYGCGIGYEFSTLRPRGAHVKGAGATTSGPLSFMDVYDRSCFTVRSAGDRRGAQMAVFDIEHPDALDFIQAKRENKRLECFNLSLLITDKFMTAVQDNEIWQPKWKGQPFGPSIKATDLWDVVMRSTYDYAEPGILFIDRINRMNTLWFCEDIRSTNPCGEQPLPPNGSCLLGSINLAKFVKNPFMPHPSFDFEKLEEVVTVFSRMLDNVVAMNGLPLKQQQKEIEMKRRHGMGFMGLGSAMIMMGITYGSEESLAFTSEVSRAMAVSSMRAGVELAREKGCAPVFERKIRVTEEMAARHGDIDPNLIGKSMNAKELYALSRYFDLWRESDDASAVLSDIEKYGSRYSHATSIAPTGTISIAYGDMVSNGIEPEFDHKDHIRNMIVKGHDSKKETVVRSFSFHAYRQLVDKDARVEDLPDYFVTADTISPQSHVDVVAAAQTWVDSAISKTINCPKEIPFDTFKDIYQYAYEKGLKGCSTFRFNPERFSGVLVRQEDLANTTYVFKFGNGSSIQARGDQYVEYRGQTHLASNLADAVRNGYLGKFA